eukprot:gene5840-6081_t
MAQKGVQLFEHSGCNLNHAGVSVKGVVELQAQLYRAQEQARLRSEGGVDITDKHIRRKAGIDVSSIRNPGVEAREARDKQLQLKSTGEGPERLAESSTALQRKAQLYDRMVRGEGLDDDDHDKYEVEFWRKGPSHQQEEAAEDDWLSNSRQQGTSLDDRFQDTAVDTVGLAVGGSGAMMTHDVARERERRQWEERESALLQQEEEEQQRRAARQNAVRELSGQTQTGRAQAAAAKIQREELLADKRARLKAAFINQQVKAIMGSKGAGSNKAGSAGSKKASAGGSTTTRSQPGS